MPGVSMVVAAASVSASPAAATKRSSASPAMPMTRPGLVQNWPEPMVSDWTKAGASVSPRAASAAGISTTGLMLDISA